MDTKEFYEAPGTEVREFCVKRVIATSVPQLNEEEGLSW